MGNEHIKNILIAMATVEVVTDFRAAVVRGELSLHAFHAQPDICLQIEQVHSQSMGLH